MPFPTIIGQERVVRILDRIINAERFLPLIFVGQSGVGKRTLALKFAQTVNCEKHIATACENCPTCRQIKQLTHPDIRIIFPIRKPSADAKPDEIISEMTSYYPDFSIEKLHPEIPANYVIPIGAIRWLANDMAKPPVLARKRFYIILHAHKMNAEAQNALLKILEEPQQNTIFVLTAITPYTLFPTIRSRCQVIRFANIAESAIISFLKNYNCPSLDNLKIASILLQAVNLAQGSIGKAVRICSNPEDYLVKPLIDFIVKPVPYSLVLEKLNELKEIEPALIINNSIYLLENLLRQLFKSPTYQSLSFNYKDFSPETLYEKLIYFYERFHLSSLNLNPTLSTYTSISQLAINTR